MSTAGTTSERGTTEPRRRASAGFDGSIIGWLHQHRWGALATVLAAVTVLLLGFWAYRQWAPDTPYMLKVELAGKASEIGKLVRDDRNAYAQALNVDYLFIAAYGVAVVTAAVVGRAISLTRTAQRVSSVAGVAAVLAALCDVAENEFLRPVIHQAMPSRNWQAVAAQAFSFTKWVLIVPAAAVAVVAVLTTVWRAVGVPVEDRVRQLLGRTRAQQADGDASRMVTLPARDEDEALAGEAIARSAWRANNRLPPRRRCGEGEIGFCVSGGGIRSATFALGALDALRSVLRQARYLVSVSGGGYAAGAMQLALQQLRTSTALPGQLTHGHSAATPADVYTAGSAELDHTRKHGRYLTDSPAEWINAVVHVLRGLLVNLLILGLVAVVLGRSIAHVFAYFPDDVLGRRGWPPAGVFWAVGAAFGAALATFVLRILVEPAASQSSDTAKKLAAGLAGVGVLLALVGVGLPLLAWVARTPPRVPALTGGAVSTLTAWVASIIAFVGKRPAVTKSSPTVWRLPTAVSSRTRGLVSNLLVAAALLLVSASLLLLLGFVLANTRSLTATSTWPLGWDEWVYTAIAAAALGFFALVDQVRWSLHPFYRRRLATAFAVRRVRAGGHGQAVPYDYDKEGTPLPEYGQRHETPGAGPDFPQIIFSCAAHDSDPEVTVPGRRVVPWSMSGDYVGSPAIGWASSTLLHEAVGPVLQADLTVQAAQAISGAAIASEMGRMQRTYAHLLTLANARLGSWLPNPAYLHRLAEQNGWWVPRMPRRRYLSTFVRELFGSYPGDGPLVYVTDGGHYDNSGLVELLRHRPAVAFCLDGSGDRPDVAMTFAQAIQLAYEELGVVIMPEQRAALEASGAGPTIGASDQMHVELADRLARRCVVTARVVYPDLGPDLSRQEGLLFLGHANLTKQMPYDILAHATRNPSFPNDSTADQWFDFAEFDAYHALGRYVGEQTLEAVFKKRIPAARTQQVTIALPTADGHVLLVDLGAGSLANN